jgi:hypothetical protein
VAAVQLIQSSAVLSLRSAKSDTEKITLNEILNIISHADGSPTAKQVLLDKDLSIKLLHHAADHGRMVSVSVSSFFFFFFFLGLNMFLRLALLHFG